VLLGDALTSLRARESVVQALSRYRGYSFILVYCFIYIPHTVAGLCCIVTYFSLDYNTAGHSYNFVMSAMDNPVFLAIFSMESPSFFILRATLSMVRNSIVSSLEILSVSYMRLLL